MDLDLKKYIDYLEPKQKLSDIVRKKSKQVFNEKEIEKGKHQLQYLYKEIEKESNKGNFYLSRALEKPMSKCAKNTLRSQGFFVDSYSNYDCTYEVEIRWDKKYYNWFSDSSIDSSGIFTFMVFISSICLMFLIVFILS